MNSSKLLGRKALYLAVSVVALGASAGANAGTATDSLSVSASVIDNCTISTEAVAFGNYDPIVANAGDDLEGAGSVTIACTLQDIVQVTLGQGSNADSGSTDAAPQRRMAKGEDFLSYALYSDSGRTAVWGNTSAVDVEDEGTGVAEEHTVYGSVASGQNVPAGAYTDSVVATVTF